MFDITQIIVDPQQVAIRLGWSYTILEGAVAGSHVLLTPAGDTPISEASKEDLIGWLVSQLENTEEEFIAEIKKKAHGEHLEATWSMFPVPE